MNNAEAIAVAALSGRAFPIFRFPSSDSGPERYIIVDGTREVHAIACKCGHESDPEMLYSDPQTELIEGDTESVAIRCDGCSRAVRVHVARSAYAAARGAMSAVVRGWWNAWMDHAGHPDDFGAAGGLLVEQAAWDEYVAGRGEGGDDAAITD